MTPCPVSRRVPTCPGHADPPVSRVRPLRERLGHAQFEGPAVSRWFALKLNARQGRNGNHNGNQYRHPKRENSSSRNPNAVQNHGRLQHGHHGNSAGHRGRKFHNAGQAQ